MNPQTSIDFTVTRHNNRESDSFYEANMEKFSDQCKKVLSILRSGQRLTVYSAMVEHGVSSLPRRILDLRAAGIPVKDEWVKDEQGKRTHKYYYL